MLVDWLPGTRQPGVYHHMLHDPPLPVKTLRRVPLIISEHFPDHFPDRFLSSSPEAELLC
jgi:hypothetical protein